MPNLIKVQVMHTILYLRGLNSQGDDSLRAGGLAFGPMHGPWLKELERRGRKATALTGFGAGPLASQIGRAAEAVRRLPEWRDPDHFFHLLGHSTGGLLARALVHELNTPERIVSVVTMATPHRGSPLAVIAESFAALHPRLHWLFCRVNYDINERFKSFADLAPDAMNRFNLKYPDHRQVSYASLVFHLPVKQMGWPVRLATSVLDEGGVLKDHDGYVESESQRWGQVLAELDLDHLTQIGFDFSLNPKTRRRHRQKFHAAGDRLEDFWRRLESGRGPSERKADL